MLTRQINLSEIRVKSKQKGIMRDEEKTKEQLISELKELRQMTSGSSISRGKSLHSDELFKEMNAHHNTLINTIPDIVYIKDIQFRNMLVNKAFEKFIGLSEADIMGKTDEQIFPPDLAEHCRQSDREVIMNCKTLRFDEEYTGKDGRKVYFDTIKSPLYDNAGNVIGLVGISRDITQRKHNEKKLELFNTLINQSNDAIFIDDPETGRFLEVNDKACSSLGYSREELLNMTVVDIDAIIPDKFIWQEHLSDLKRQGYIILEGRHKRKDGTTFPVEVNVKYIKQDEQNYLVAVVRDIRERKEMEERYRTIVRSSMDCFWLLDTEGHILDVNDASCKLLGYSRKELLTMRIPDIEVIETPEETGFHIRRVMETGYDRFETRHKLKDGSVVDVEVSCNYLKMGSGLFFVFSRDITDRKRAEKQKLEEEIIKAQKLDSIGVLAGGIAHDFNNILTAILGNISLSKESLPPESSVSKYLSEAEIATFRAQDLTKQLLTFSKGGAPVKRTISLSQIIRESANFVLRGSNVRCEHLIAEGLKPVEADEGQISQVIHNLIINADQAMPEGGIVRIRCENVFIGTESHLPLKNGSYVKISVEDTGIGIPEDHLQKIFDPYFTTKKKGSGLGLSTAYSIIKKHDGLITADSALGAGTAFHIYLPASEKKIALKTDEEKTTLFGKGKILLMDDEEMVRKVAGEILGYIGYKIEFAADGQEAIELYKRARDEGKPFDLLIMDLTVPGAMGGKEAVKELLKLDPGIKAIVSSGYSSDPVMADYLNYGFKGVITKPYKITTLSNVVYEVINKK